MVISWEQQKDVRKIIEELVILTTVDNAYLNYRKENQQAIGKVTVNELKQYLQEVQSDLLHQIIEMLTLATVCLQELLEVDKIDGELVCKVH